MHPETIRRHLALSRSQLAEALGVSRNTVSRYEAARSAPRWYTLACLALYHRLDEPVN